MKVYKGNEPLKFNNKTLDLTILDFWKWNSSSLLNNSIRGPYAEFLVASALGLDLEESHNDWDPYSFLWNGLKVEVKCSAHLHPWSDEPSKNIFFSIAPAYEWLPNSTDYNEYARHSDVYVFCYYTCLKQDSAALLNLDNWNFYVLSRKRIDETYGNQKGATLRSIIRRGNALICKYDEIADTIKKEMEENS